MFPPSQNRAIVLPIDWEPDVPPVDRVLGSPLIGHEDEALLLGIPWRERKHEATLPHEGCRDLLLRAAHGIAQRCPRPEDMFGDVEPCRALRGKLLVPSSELLKLLNAE